MKAPIFKAHTKNAAEVAATVSQLASTAAHTADINHAAEKAADKAADSLDFWTEKLPIEAKKEAYRLAAKRLADAAEFI